MIIYTFAFRVMISNTLRRLERRTDYMHMYMYVYVYVHYVYYVYIYIFENVFKQHGHFAIMCFVFPLFRQMLQNTDKNHL